MKLIQIVSSLVIASMFMSGCAEDTYNKKNMKLEVPILTSDGEVLFKNVEVPSPDNLETLSSQQTNFYIGGGSVYKKYCRKNESDTYPTKFCGFEISGKLPKFRFIRKGDTFVPTSDLNTLIAAGTYYHMIEVEKKLKAYSDYIPNFFPRRFHLGVWGATNNGFFSPEGDFMGLGNYTGSKLPLALNPLVVYHELSHAIFNRVIVNQYQKKYPGFASYRFLDSRSRVQTYKNLRSINEGMADLFSYIMTGGTNVFEHSAENRSLLKSRELDSPNKGHLPSSSNPYDVGQYFAKKFIEYSMAKQDIKNLKASMLTEESRLQMLDDYFSFIAEEVAGFFTDYDSVDDSSIEEKLDSYFQKQIKSEVKGNKETETKSEIEPIPGTSSEHETEEEQVENVGSQEVETPSKEKESLEAIKGETI